MMAGQDDKSLVQRVKRGASSITGADALGALKQLVDATRESIEIHEVESTKREKLRSYRETEVARINASERVLREYFDRVFAERKQVHSKLFESLDHALEAGDMGAVQTVVGGIVAIAKDSPLANIGDLSQLRNAWDDPDLQFEL